MTNAETPSEIAQIKIKSLSLGLQSAPRTLLVIDSASQDLQRSRIRAATFGEELGDATADELFKLNPTPPTVANVKAKLQARLPGAKIEEYAPAPNEYAPQGKEAGVTLLVTGSPIGAVRQAIAAIGHRAQDIDGGIARGKTGGDKPSRPDKEDRAGEFTEN